MPARATKATDKLITLAEVLLGCRYHKGDVKRLLAKAFESENAGDTISSRSLETIISAARINLGSAQSKTRDQLRDEACQFYDSVLRNPIAKVREKILAQAQFDKLMGLRAPITHLLDGTLDHTGTVGVAGVDLTQLTDEQLDALHAIAKSAIKVAGPGSDSGGKSTS